MCSYFFVSVSPVPDSDSDSGVLVVMFLPPHHLIFGLLLIRCGGDFPSTWFRAGEGKTPNQLFGPKVEANLVT